MVIWNHIFLSIFLLRVYLLWITFSITLYWTNFSGLNHWTHNVTGIHFSLVLMRTKVVYIGNCHIMCLFRVVDMCQANVALHDFSFVCKNWYSWSTYTLRHLTLLTELRLCVMWPVLSADMCQKEKCRISIVLHVRNDPLCHKIKSNIVMDLI